MDGSVRIWHAHTGQVTACFQHGAVPVGDIRFSEDGKMLITSNNEAILKFWDIETGACIRTVETNVMGNRTKAVAIGADGNLVATGSAGPNVYLWKNASAETPTEPVILEGHTSRVWGFALSADERYLATSDEEGTTIISDVPLGKTVEKILIDRPYERMNIRGVTGLNAAERAALKALGAVETETPG
jgi:WD40 repeat protein